MLGRLFKKICLALVVVSLVSVSPAVSNAEQYDIDFWHQKYAYTSAIGPASSGGGLPSSYDYLGNSTAVISTYGMYYPNYGYGYERARIWSRPDYVKPWMESKNGAHQVMGVKVLKAVLQFQSQNLDPKIWIDGSEPADSNDETIDLPDWVFDVLGIILPATGQVLGAVVSKIDGFKYASVNIAWPNAGSRNQNYVEWYNAGGLPYTELSTAYSYNEADKGSENSWRGASARWKYSISSQYTNYPVQVYGRLMYEADNWDGSGPYGWYYTYSWTGLAVADHAINKS